MTDTIRILHVEHPGYGWGFDSPDVDGLIGGAETYEEAHQLAEEAVRFHLEDDPERLRQLDAGELTLVHFVPEHSAGIAAAAVGV